MSSVTDNTISSPRTPKPPYAQDDDRASTKEAYYPSDNKTGPLIDPGLVPVHSPTDFAGHSQEQKIVSHGGPADAPEAVSYAPYYSPSSPYPSQGYPPSYGGPHGGHDQAEPAQPKKSIWTKKRLMLIAIILLIIIAAVLGGVLGTQLNKSSNSSNSSDGNSGSSGSNGSNGSNNNSNTTSPPISPNTTSSSSALLSIDRTGIATTTTPDGSSLLLYYQHPNSSILEAIIPLSSLSSSSQSYTATSLSPLPITDIAPGTPLSAITYTTNSTTFRHLFYARLDLRIMQIYTTNTTTTWSQPLQISPQADDQYLFSGSSGLCAVPFRISSSGDFFGARVYFSQKQNWVQELFWDQRRSGIDSLWEQGQIFFDGAAGAGTGCAVTYRGNDAYTSVWFKNSTTGGVAHSWLPNNGRTGGWRSTQESRLAFEVGDSTAISVAYDQGSNVVYLSFEGTDGLLYFSSLQAAPPTSADGSYFNFAPVRNGKLGSYVVDGSPVVVQQFNGSELRAQRIARQGSVLSNGTIVG
ncbi:Hypothetical protein D9617_10g072680 [Elsinoe fawcettii]|nr:Hypothetical protein D9617_10g072680 [Elsinoe fawcettii]